jgi:hypothetical protein
MSLVAILAFVAQVELEQHLISGKGYSIAV